MKIEENIIAIEKVVVENERKLKKLLKKQRENDIIPDEIIVGIKAIVQNPDQFHICAIISRKEKVEHSYFKKYVLFNGRYKFTYCINQLIKYGVIKEDNNMYSFANPIYNNIINSIKEECKK
jgi:hypothetical protein